MPVVNLLEEIRRESSSVFGGPKGMMDELRGADCLVLDDFGMQKGSEWVDERLYGLINDRYNAGKPIIVTTNARSMEDFKSMAGKSGAQIESRLSVMAASFLIEAPDFRKRGGGKTA
jgi:DNA replication protein DnaC